MLVTIGVASFNNGRYIVKLLDSILNQSYPYIELLIVDDCSTDNSISIIEEWISANNYPVQLTRRATNQGVVATFAELRRQARGEFTLWIGSDDWLLPHMVADTVAEFNRQGQACGAVYSDCLLVNDTGEVIKPSFLQHFNARFGPHFPEKNLRIALLSGFYVPTVTCMVRRHALEQIGPYDLMLHSEDLDTWLRLSMKWQFAYLPKVTAAYRVHEKSLTSSSKPSLNETYLLIYKKSNFEQGSELTAAKTMLAEHAEHYYRSKHRDAASFIYYAYQQTGSLKLLGFWIAAHLGLKHKHLLKLFSGRIS